MAGEETQRFEKRRQDVIHAASVLINEVGVKGTTLADVAASVGLNATSITYYFSRKDKLIVAVYEETLDLLVLVAEEAAKEPDPRSRVRHFIDANIALRRRIRDGEVGLLTALSEMRTLEGKAQQSLMLRYRRLLDIVRSFFGETKDRMHQRIVTARSHALLESVFWWPVWSQRYSAHDFARVGERWFDILDKGLAARPGTWHPKPINGDWRTNENSADDTLSRFLRSATVMINQRGYRGASVNRIAKELNVTKGSFYHHHNARDDLILSCFDRSHDRLEAVQLAALSLDADYWTQLTSALAELLDLQFFDHTPLLRTTALQAMPAEDRQQAVTRYSWLARRFAGILIDGIADRSIRAIDPMIASQIIMSTLNSAYEARGWAARFDKGEDAVAIYASIFLDGIFADHHVAAKSPDCL